MKYVLMLAALLFPSLAHAEMHTVKMLDRNASGSMVYEPPYLAVKPGDTVKFLATARSHNAASIKKMTPEGAKYFLGQIDEEIEVKFDVPGIYGIKCTPHYAMGMVMIIQVGDKVATKDDVIKDMPRRSYNRLVQYINDFTATQ